MLVNKTSGIYNEFFAIPNTLAHGRITIFYWNNDQSTKNLLCVGFIWIIISTSHDTVYKGPMFKQLKCYF